MVAQVQCVGFFSDPVEAARAYDRAAIEWRGNKAVTNFPRDSYTDDGQQSAPDPHDAAAEVNTFTFPAGKVLLKEPMHGPVVEQIMLMRDCLCFQQVRDAADGESALIQPAAAAAATTFTDTTKSQHVAEELEGQATAEASASGLAVGERAGRSDLQDPGTQAPEPPPPPSAVRREGAPSEAAPGQECLGSQDGPEAGCC